MGEYSSITRTGKHEPFELHVQRGYVQEHKSVSKFGYATSVSGTEVAVFDGGIEYVYATSAAPMNVYAGSGANTTSKITIEGLDADYNELSNTVTLNATTTVVTSGSFIRVNRMFTSNDVEAAEDVFVKNSAGELNSHMLANENQSLQAVYTIPAGYTGYLDQVAGNSATEVANKFVRMRLKVREPGGVFRTRAKFTLADSSYEEIFKYPIEIPEKSDIEMTAESSSGVNEVAAVFNLLLIANEYTV